MATNHTTNYNLNLWEASDKFVREEFNENTTKLDAALKAEADARAAALTAETTARTAAVQDLENRKAGFVLLKEITLTEQVTQLNIDVSDINWGAWQYVFMDFDLDGAGTITIYPNNISDYTHTQVPSGSTNIKSMAGAILVSQKKDGRRICFHTCKSPWRTIMVTTHTSTWGGDSYVTYANFNILNLSCTGAINSGSKLRFWGLA